jgi:four helix bundle protein
VSRNVAETRYSLEDFELYRCGREFRKKVYRLIALLSPCEKYCLAPQMRRAALSVSNNIAEGHGRCHHQENIQFCRIARGSVEETIDDLNTCLDEKYGPAELVLEIKSDAYSLISRLNGYIAYLRRTRQGTTP